MSSKRILMTVAYDGTGFAGFQKQKSGVPTIAQILEEAIEDLTGEKTEVLGASRTDAGVHALCNLAVFDTGSRIPAGKFARALNVRLPEQVRVLDSCEVPADFHPRFCGTIKTYEYRIYNAPFPSPARRRYSYYSYTPFDVERMRSAAAFLEGEHDFASFCSAHAQVNSTVREITSISVEEYPCGLEREAQHVLDSVRRIRPEEEILQAPEGAFAAGSLAPREIIIRVSGKGFLYNMVRIIAGTLMEAGRGAIEPEQMPDILAAKDRSAAGPTAPPEGLTLVNYEFLETHTEELTDS